MLLRLRVLLHRALALVQSPSGAWRTHRLATSVSQRRGDDRGQGTAEYGLVMVAAGAIAIGVILWARNGDGLTSLFKSVVDQLTGAVG